MTPDGVQDELIVSASRFVSNEQQLRAIDLARIQSEEAIAAGTNQSAFNISFDGVIGEGFGRYGTTYQQTRVVRVVFRQDGTVLTAFPELARNGFDVYPLFDLPPGAP